MATSRTKDTAPAESFDASTDAPETTEQKLSRALTMLAEGQARMADLMEQQAAYNKAALRMAPRRKKSMGEYLKERNDKGRSKFLPHIVYQNGREVNPSGLSNETIAVLDTLATGKYCGGIVDVVRVQDGPGGVNSRIHLCYNNGTMEERMGFYMRFPTFTKLVQDIAAEMAARGIAPVIEKGRDKPEFEFPDELKELV
jgi:hypothetical protein